MPSTTLQLEVCMYMYVNCTACSREPLLDIALSGCLFRLPSGVKPAIGGMVLGTLLRWVEFFSLFCCVASVTQLKCNTIRGSLWAVYECWNVVDRSQLWGYTCRRYMHMGIVCHVSCVQCSGGYLDAWSRERISEPGEERLHQEREVWAPQTQRATVVGHKPHLTQTCLFYVHV